MGGKFRIAKEILKIILSSREDGQYYVEPFCGGCNVIDKVTGPRIANDIHEYLIDMWKKVVEEDWVPPTYVSEEEYRAVKYNKDNYDKAYVGYVGFNSYGGRWFEGYARNKSTTIDYWDTQSRVLVKQAPLLKGVEFNNVSYDNLIIPNNSIVYCDPPYEGTKKYKDRFDSDKFWDWARNMSSKHTVFVSEYKAPSDFECVWEKELKSNLKIGKAKLTVEKLWKKK